MCHFQAGLPWFATCSMMSLLRHVVEMLMDQFCKCGQNHAWLEGMLEKNKKNCT